MVNRTLKPNKNTQSGKKPQNTIERRIPKQERSKKMVETILDTAITIISDPESPKLTTHLIAKTAGVAVGSLYQFFPNIQAVRASIIERMMDRLYGQFVDAWSAVDSVEDLAPAGESLVSITYDFYYQYPDVVNIMVASRNTEEFHQVNNAQNQRLLELIIGKVLAVNSSVDESVLRRQVRVATHIGDIMTMLIWTSKTEEDRQAYLSEWKTLTRIYVSNMVKEF